MFDKVFNLTTLNGTNGFTIPGLNPRDGFGWSVSNAGDINHDGITDIAIGARYGGNSNGGAVYVIFGQKGGFPATFNVTTLNGTNGFSIAAPAVYRLGASVGTAGDMNGDHIDDLVVGAPYSGDNRRGGAYVIFGQKGRFPATLNVATLNGTNGFLIFGTANDELGTAVNTAGDINDDHIDDLIVGAPFSGISSSGAAYVIFGQKGGFPATFNVTTLNGINGFSIAGQAGSRLGFSVSTAGDINDDHIGDLVVGAWGSNGETGAAYVIFGQKTGFPDTFDLNILNGTNGFSIAGWWKGNRLGGSVSTAGDINGDYIDDLVVGGYTAGYSITGAAYAIYGQKTRFPAIFNVTTLNGINGFSMYGLDLKDSLGSSVSTAGDINGDGKSDLIVGSEVEGAYVILGSAKSSWRNVVDLGRLNGHDGFAIPGIFPSEGLGHSVSKAGDINGDGIDDTILGGGYSSPSHYSHSYVIFGKFPLILGNNQMTITQGQSLILSSDNLNATDLNGFSSKLNFNISHLQGGQFISLDNPSIPLNIFSQQDIIDRKISFIKDTTPEVSYAVEVTNGAVSTKPVKANVTFKFAPPTLVNNQITIQQGKSIILTPENLSATDFNFPANTLIFNVNHIQGGRFEFLDDPGVSVTSFTQQDIMDAKIQFVQDGSKKVGYEISVSDDSGLKTPPAAAHVNFIRVYQPPKLNNPIPDQSAKVNVPFNIEIPPNTFIDPDGDFNSNQLIYSASQADGNPLPDWVSFANQSFLGTAPSAGNNRFSLFAANPANRSAVSSTNFSLSVVEASLSIGAMIGIGLGVGGGVLLLIALGALFYYHRTKIPTQPNSPALNPPSLDTLLINDNHKTFQTFQ